MRCWIAAVFCFVVSPLVAQPLSDIRPEEIRGDIGDQAAAKGREVFRLMQEAYGLSAWKTWKNIEFDMTSVWHVDDSGWPANPLKFWLDVHERGSDNADLWFLNGPLEGQGWALEDGKHFDLNYGRRVPKEGPDPHTKVIIKNWWFQFPFRITEASVISYAGSEQVNGRNYDRVYATWGSEEPNETYDQYLLYVDHETKRMTWYYFTHRKANPAARISIEQSDFREIGGVLVPYKSTVRRTPPGKGGPLVHVNTYDAIRFEK